MNRLSRLAIKSRFKEPTRSQTSQSVCRATFSCLKACVIFQTLGAAEKSQSINNNNKKERLDRSKDPRTSWSSDSLIHLCACITYSVKMLDAWQLLADQWSVALKIEIQAMQKYSKACLRVHGSTYFIGFCLMAVTQLGGAIKFISVVFQFTAHAVNPALSHSLTFGSLICICSRPSLSSLQHTIS